MDTTKEALPVETPPPPPPPPPLQLLPHAENQEPPHQDIVNATPSLDTSENHAFLSNAHKPKTSCSFDNFKKLVKDVAFACSKTNSLTSVLQLQHHLDHIFPRLHTPDHPPYAAMIQEAIEQLNEEEGSGKERISTCIRAKYKDLPWAHDGMLEHHLYLLCKNSYLVQTEDGRYLFANGAIESSDGPSHSPDSTAPTSPSVSSSYNSFSSSSSGSGSDYRSEVLGKRKLLPKKDKKARRRKRIRKSSKSVDEICAGRTKSSIIRLGKSSKEDGFLISSEMEAETKHGLMLQEKEKESNEVALEAYGSTDRSWGGTTDTDSEFHEQENQNKKQARTTHGKGNLNGKRKKTVKTQTQVAPRGRGRPPKKVVREISDEENCVMTEDKIDVSKQETKSLDKQSMEIEKLNEVTGRDSKVTEQEKAEKSNGEGGISPPYDERNTEEEIKQLRIVSGDHSPDEVFEKQNSHANCVNEVLGEQTKLLQLLQESASGEYLPGQEDEEEEAYKQIEVLVGYTEATTKKQGRSNMRKCKQGVNTERITPVQTPIAGKGSGSGKRRGRPRKQLVFEETKPIPGEMVENNETTGKRRGRPRKQLVFEETKPNPEEMVANNETTGKAHQFQEAKESNQRDVPLEVQIAVREQNLQDEVPKKRRGRPPKTEKKLQQDPIELGKELKKKRVRKRTSVPGRKPGRPPKSDLSSQLQMVQEKFETIALRDISGKTIEEENDSKITTSGPM